MRGKWQAWQAAQGWIQRRKLTFLASGDYISMMKRPERRRIQRHRKTPPPAGVSLQDLAEQVRYVGAPEHKLTPSFAGYPAPRADASVREASLANQRGLVQSWLRDAIRQGQCGGPWEGRYPRYVWRRTEDEAHEARLTNRSTGEYKGYPIGFEECPI